MEFDLPRSTAVKAVYLAGVWPASFMLLAGYPDSLLAACSVWSLCFARKNDWWLAGLLGMFAAASKAVGCVVAVTLALCLHRFVSGGLDLLFKFNFVFFAAICGLALHTPFALSMKHLVGWVVLSAFVVLFKGVLLWGFFDLRRGPQSTAPAELISEQYCG